MTLETIAPLSTRRELASVGGLTDSALPEVTPDPVHDVISFEWFGDAKHLDRFVSWLGESGGRPASSR